MTDPAKVRELIERLEKNASLQENGPYVSLKENREALREAATTLRDMLGQAEWRPISEAPIDADVLMFCPDRGIANEARIELGCAHSSRGSHHSWATHFLPLPAPPQEDA